MPLDDLAEPLAEPITHRRPRWEVGQGPNPLGGVPSVVYLGSWVYCTADGTDVGAPMRDPALDSNVKFDPENPQHLAAFGALDAVVKADFLARKAATQAEQE